MAIVGAPLKSVTFLHMDSPNETIPSGWAICNGQTLTSSQQDINTGGNYTLPDLRNCFILGADSTQPAGFAGSTSQAPGPKGVGGSMSTSLTLNQMPRHTHPLLGTLSGLNTAGGGFGSGSSGNTVQNIVGNITVGYQGGVQGDSNWSDGTGGDTPIDNRPAYFGLTAIMRVKL